MTVDVTDLYPLTPMQEGMLFETIRAPDASVYVQQLSCLVRGALDEEAFTFAWQAVVDRHDALRTSFSWEDADRPVQLVHRKVVLPITRLSWVDVGEAEQASRLEVLLERDRATGFDLRDAPLMRLTLVHLGPTRVQVVWTHHHVVLDGWSLPIVLRDVLRLYEARVNGRSAALPPAPPFRALISHIRKQGADTTRARAEVIAELEGFTAPTALPLAHAAKPTARAAGAHRESSTSFTREETARLAARARVMRVTVASLLTAAWAVVLARHAGVDDVVFGVAVSGRPADLRGADATVGMFVDTVPVRVRLGADEPAADVVRAVHTSLAAHAAHAHVSLAELHAATALPPGSPLFESVVAFESYPSDPALAQGVAGVSIEALTTHERSSVPLTVIAAPGEMLRLGVLCDPSRFDEDASHQLLDRLARVVRGLAGDEPGAIADITLADPPALAAPRASFPVTHGLFALFTAQAARTPGAVAVRDGDRECTYRELARRANAVAHTLAERGIGPGSPPVAVAVDRSLELVVAVMGVLGAGAAYLPLDPGYPEARLGFQLHDAGTALLLTKGPSPSWAAAVPSLDVVDVGTIGEAASPPAAKVTPDDLAYVIYTSGSTGQPKGVLVTNANVVRLFDATRDWLRAGPGDVFSLFHSIAFDFSVWELFGALLHGAALVIVPTWTARSPDRFRDLLAAARVTILSQTPSAFDALIRADEAATTSLALRLVVFGGEALRVERLAPWFAQHGDESPRLVNMFGITETTVHVTVRPLTKADVDQAVPGQSVIGVPLPDLSVEVRDSRGRPVAAGVTGELWVGGAGVARGYLNRPELTKERFVFSERGERLYRTGDRGRLLVSGTRELVHLGRIDDQLKIRGYRIEPREVESVLERHPSVRSCAVVAREDEIGDRRLVAFVVPHGAPEVEGWRAHAASHLIEAMVPAFVVLEALPLTPNGKVDRAALARSPIYERAARVGGASSTALPKPSRDALLDLVASIWADLLSLPHIGDDDDVFHLGAHSLLATRAASRLRRATSREIGVRMLFEHPTPGRLVAAIREGEGAAADGGPSSRAPLHKAVNDAGVFPLSFAQQRLWLAERLEDGGGRAATIPVAMRLQGRLDRDALARAWDALLGRHASLRAVIVEQAGEPLQRIRDDVRSPLRIVEVSSEDAAHLAAHAEVARAFDLVEGPLARATLFVFPGAAVLLLALHHLVADGWSVGIMLRDLAEAYSGVDLAPLPVDYQDFATWQRATVADETTGLAYFRRALALAPAAIDLPLDRARPLQASAHGAEIVFTLDTEDARALEARSRASSSTLFMSLLAGLQILLSRASGQDDVSIGVSVAGRTVPETEAMVGFFVNVLVLRARLAGEETIADRLDDARRIALDAFAHQDLPFERIVEDLRPPRSAAHSPLFQVNFVYQNLPREPIATPDLVLEPVLVESGAARFDLVVTMEEPRGGPLRGTFTYRTALFDRETIAGLVAQYCAILHAIARGTGDARVDTLPLGPVGAPTSDVVAAQASDLARVAAEPLHALVSATATRSPSAVAITHGDVAVTYGDFDTRARHLAAHLRGLGITTGARVAIAMPSRVARVVAILAVLHAGGSFVPIDPAEPFARVASILEQAAVAVVITDAETEGDLPSVAGQVVTVDDDGVAAGELTTSGARPQSSDDRPTLSSLDDYEAYVLFTSGSTGRPKGVAIGHRGLSNMVLAQVEAFGITPTDRVLQVASFSFDACVSEIAMALVAGATLDLGPRDGIERARMSDVLRERETTVVTLPPSLLRITSEVAPPLRVVIAAGESCFDDVALRWSRGRRFFNAYGPTECTVCATLHEYRGETAGRVSIGLPLPGIRARVVDAGGEEVPAGIAGELELAGIGLAIGYLDPGLTAAAFVVRDGERRYRTGDITRRRRDGTLEHLGRADDQVKVRGHRIELGEVGAAMAALPQVLEAVAAVVIHDDEPILVGYVVPEPADDREDEDARARLGRAELARALATKLPTWMVPTTFVTVPTALPRTTSGKIDRRALPLPSFDAAEEHARAFEPPRDALDLALATIWSSLLGTGAIGRTDDFFDLGGHSLLAAQLVARVRETLGYDVALRAVFDAPTLGAYADVVRGMPAAGTRPERVERTPMMAPSFAQERLWVLEQIHPGTSAYVLAAAFVLRGALDVGALARAFDALLARHEPLRTRFVAPDGVPFAVIDPPGHTSLLRVVDLRAQAENAREAIVASARDANAVTAFDLARGPLVRATLLLLDETRHVLLVAAHHAILDAPSLDVLVGDLVGTMRGEALPPLDLQYADWAAFERRTFDPARLEVWTRELAGAAGTPKLGERPPPPGDAALAVPNAAAAAGRVRATVDRAAVERAARRARVTPFMFLLAAFELLVARRSGERDITIGAPVTARIHPDARRMVGLAMNTVAIRVRLDDVATVGELLATVRAACLRAYAHGDVPFERVVEAVSPRRDLSQNPLFQALFTLDERVPAQLALPGLTIEAVASETDAAKLDLSIAFTPRGDDLEMILEHRTDVIGPALAARIAGQLCAVVRSLGEAPLTTPVDSIDLRADGEARELTASNDTAEPTFLGRTILRSIVNVAKAGPERIAVLRGDTQLTYGGLLGRARALASNLRARGAGGSAVVVAVSRGPELVVALLGVLLAGAAYVPVTRALPERRRASMVRTANARLVVTTEPDRSWAPRSIASDASDACDARDVVLVDAVTSLGSQGMDAGAATHDEDSVLDGADALAYVLFTSGSTGEPKGVAVRHESLANLIFSMNRAIGIGRDDVVLGLTPVTFDIAAFELWSSLTTGATLVMASDDEARDGAALADVIRRTGVTVVQATPSSWRMLLDAPSSAEILGAPRLRKISGGEALGADLAARLLALGPTWNVYGPTETTVWSTIHTVSSADVRGARTVPIGRPLWNTRLLVTDARGIAAPIGAPGELWIGGAGVARGYVGDDALTAARFVDTAEGRFYRTGDQARLREDGALEWLGRGDLQLKIRGHRVELGEIEAALASCGGVREAAVIAAGEADELRLVAFVVLAGGGSTAPLREALVKTLPDAHVPSDFVVRAELPRTANGKLDRAALTAIASESRASCDRREPASAAIGTSAWTSTEQALAAIWAEVLGRPITSTSDDFFTMGGHSLLAARVGARLRAALDFDVPLRELFENTTLAALAARIEDLSVSGGASPARPPRLPPIPRHDPSPTRAPSLAEERMWMLAALEPRSATYHVPVALRLDGELDVDALERALGVIAARHEPLRTTFALRDGALHASATAPQPYVLVREDVAEALLSRWIANVTNGDIDLATGPVWRARLARVGPRDHVLVMVVHHVATDAWSMRTILRELAAVYTGRSLAPLECTYADYAAWQRAELAPLLAPKIAAFRDVLASSTPLDVPSDRPRRAGSRSRGRSVTASVAAHAVAPLRRLASSEGATLFMALLASFDLLLSRHAGATDVTVGVPVAGRREVALEPLVGLFVNTLAVRTNLGGSPDARELVRRVRDSVRHALDLQDAPFADVVKAVDPPRDPARTPLFQAMFVFNAREDADPDLVLPNLTVHPVTVDTGASPFELTLAASELPTGGLDLSLEYRTDLFDPETATSLLTRFITIATTLPTWPSAASTLPLGDDSLLSSSPSLSSSLSTLPAAIAAHATTTPTAVGLLPDRGAPLTYAALDRAARHAATVLRERGAREGTRVAISMDRSPRMIIAVLATWYAGAAYVAVDKSWPEARVRWVMEDARVIATIDDIAVAGIAWDAVDSVAPATLAMPAPESSAYVLYTSGSTGTPKGVDVSHASVANLAHAMQEVLALRSTDRVLQFASLAFDASVEEIAVTLGAGATLVLRPPGPPGSIQSFVADVERLAVTILDLPTAFWHAWVGEAPDALPSCVRAVVVGGEAASRDRLERWRPAQQRVGARFINTYGPTEATVTATSWCLDPDAPLLACVPIGRPITGVNAYVLDERRRPVPMGAVGELWLGGAGVARGYVASAPAEEAARFVADPFAGGASRMYRTGDRVVLRRDGLLEFLGRIDDQVKLRGQRIEPAEIAAVLRTHDAIRDAVVVLRDADLVAYVVPQSGSVEALAVEEIAAHARRVLPAIMVPARFVVVADLPRTTSGKIDIARLPLSDGRRESSAPTAPRSAVEASLAAMWRELLAISEVGVHDDFFALGGHSLLATQLLSRIRAAFDVELAVRVVFEHPTIAAMAVQIEASRSDDALLERLSASKETSSTPRAPAIGPRPKATVRPLSFAQERLYFLQRLAGDDPFYNLPSAIELCGPLDVDAMCAAFRWLVARHEILRATFHDRDGVVVQQVDTRDFALTVHDAASLADATRIATEDARTPFDLSCGPLLRASLLSLGPAHHVLVTTMHHIVADGWSTSVMMRELGIAYTAIASGVEPPLGPPPVVYADVAHWQRTVLDDATLERHLAFFRTALAGAPPLLDLPTDRRRPPEQSFAGADAHFDWPPHVAEAVRALARRESATPFMVLLAAFDALLGRLADVDDVVIGASVAGRDAIELEALVGFFVNIVVLRADLAGDPSFIELVRRTRERTLEAFAHRALPFDKLVEALRPERSLGHAPLFQVNFVLQNAPEAALSLPGLTMNALPVPAGSARFDLALSMEESARGLRGTLTYRTDLFDPATAERTTTQLRTLLESALADPNARLSTLQVDPEEDEHASATTPLTPLTPLTPPWPTDRGIHHLFEATARERPESIALHDRSTTVTYAALDAASACLAATLREAGVGRGLRVAIALPRGRAMIVAVLAVWRAGASYVPIDLATPLPRVSAMIDDAAVSVAIADGVSADLLPTSLPRVIEVDADGVSEPRRAGAADTTCAGTGPMTRGEDEAYVLFTSGSTGRPKGVSVGHAGLVNLALAQRAAFGLTPNDRVLQLAPFGFDASVAEIVTTLTEGAALDLGEGDAWGESEPLEELLTRRSITVLTAPPTLLREMDPDRARTLRIVISAGEACDVSTARRWAPGRLLFDAYGPTEATVCATVHRVDPADLDAIEAAGTVPIGLPITGVVVDVRGKSGERAPVGGFGELWIGGAGVAAGYVGHDNTRFVRDPRTGARMFRTGDRVRDRGDGVLLFAGRLDTQLKIRGHRVEPGDIETALLRHPAVEGAAVVLRDVGERPALVAFVVGDDRGDDLRAHLGTLVPPHMIPARIVRMASLPRSTAGKVDRAALVALALDGDRDLSAGAAEAHVAPHTDTERALADIWSHVLGVERIGATDNFFTLGGDSIASLKAVARAAAAGIVFTPKQIFEHQTVATLAAHVSRATPAASNQAPLGDPSGDEHGDRGDRYPLSPLQEGLLFHALYEADSAVYVSQFTCTLHGSLDLARFTAAWATVMARHPVLRTSLRWEDLDRPEQVVHALVPVPLVLVDSGADRETLAAEERQRRFDLAQAPLFRLVLVRRPSGEHDLIWTHHHIVLDGWSVATVLGEVLALATRDEPLPPARPYRDYIDWLARADRAAAATWFERALAGVTRATPLGFDAPSRSHGASVAARSSVVEITTRLAVSDTTALAAMCRASALTPSTVVTGAWGELLARHARSDDAVVGVTVAGRPAQFVDGAPIVGLFINTLPVRVRRGADVTARDWLRSLQEHLAEMREHEHAALADVHRATAVPAGDPLFESTVVYESFPSSPTGSDVRITDVGGAEQTSYPITVVAAPGEALELRIAYDPARFDGAAMGAALDELRNLVVGLAHAPASPVAAIAHVARTDAAARLRAGEGPRDDRFVNETVASMFAIRAEEHPERIAIEHHKGSWSYAELAGVVARLAGALVAAGVGPGHRVAICVERSPALVASLLAVAWAGAVAVPLDPLHPPSRVAFAIADSAAEVIIASHATALFAATVQGRARTLVLDSEALRAAAAPIAAQASAAAYVLYTSGSTGRPKGVVVPHAALASYLGWARDAYGKGASQSAALHTSIAFDLTLTSALLPVVSGGRVVVIDDRRGPLGVAEHITAASNVATATKAAAPIGLLKLTPSHLALLLGALGEDFAGRIADVIVLGGEALPVELVRALRRADPGARIWNEYGPTEACIGCTAHEVADDDAPIGVPITNTAAHVLDPCLEPCADGIAGDLYLAGRSLALGYVDASQTDERFFTSATTKDAEGRPLRLYRTGDRARRRAGGVLEYLGRADDQIKIRGHRIELGEIEGALRRHPSVADVAVIFDQGRLVAHVVAREETAALDETLRGHLRRELPEPFHPHAFVLTKVLPLAPSGKVDRAALARLRVTAPTAPKSGHTAPLTEQGRTIAGIFETVLSRSDVASNDDFFLLGGDSIVALQVIARAAQQGLHVTPKQIFELRTVEGIAAAATPRPVPALHAVAARGVGVAPVTPIQAWFFAKRRRNASHYNQSALFAGDGSLDDHALREAFAAALDHHGVTRVSFVCNDEATGEIRQHYRQQRTAPGWQHEDLSAVGDSDLRATIETLAQDAQRSLDLDAGRLAHGLHVDLGRARGFRLLFVLHHLVVDAVSWQPLLEDIHAAYAARLRRAPVALTTARSFLAWAQLLERHACSPSLTREAEYWLRVVAASPSLLPRIKLDRETPGTNAEARVAQFTMPVSLVQRAAARTDARVHEVLLAALAQAVGAESGAREVLIDVEGHGREVPAGEHELDLSRTVGWFTALHPMRLPGSPATPTEPGGDASHVAAVRAEVRRVPGGGIGHGLLRWMKGGGDDPARTTVRARLEDGAKSDVSFNFLGRLDGAWNGGDADASAPRLRLRPAVESRGEEEGGDEERLYAIEVNGFIAGGSVTLEWAHDRSQITSDRIDGMTARMVDFVRRLGEIGDSGESAGRAAAARSVPIAAARADGDRIVTLARGSGATRALFLVHPVGGQVGCYADLAQAMEDRTIHGIQAAGHDGQEPLLGSIEAMAAHYVTAIRHTQPRGPYLVGGWSMGALVGLELARLLALEGERCDLVVLDQAPSEISRERDDGVLLSEIATGLVGPVRLRGRTYEEQLTSLVQEAAAREVPLDAEQIRRHVATTTNGFRALAMFEPRPMPGRAIVLRASQPADRRADAAREWSAFARGGVALRMTPGDHVTMLRAPHVHEVATLLGSSLGASLEVV